MSKALFFDIDGTLVNFDGKMLESTKNALKKAQQNGHKIVLCSGRSLCQIYPFLLEMKFDGIIAASGASVIYKDQIIFKHYLKRETLRKVLEIMEESKAHYLTHTCDKILLISEQILPLHMKSMKENEKGHIAIEPRLALRTDIEKISYFDATMSLECIKERLLDCCEITGMSFEKMTSNSGEITDKGVTKALGIQKFIEYLDISKDDTISFGDGANDYEMIEYAKIGVAMGNASETLKKKANYITASIDENGIEKALKHFNLI